MKTERPATFTVAIKKHFPLAKGASFVGVPLKDMDHDELVGVIGYLFRNPSASKHVNPSLQEVLES